MATRRNTGPSNWMCGRPGESIGTVSANAVEIRWAQEVVEEEGKAREMTAMQKVGSWHCAPGAATQTGLDVVRSGALLPTWVITLSDK